MNGVNLDHCATLPITSLSWTTRLYLRGMMLDCWIRIRWWLDHASITSPQDHGMLFISFYFIRFSHLIDSILFNAMCCDFDWFDYWFCFHLINSFDWCHFVIRLMSFYHSIDATISFDWCHYLTNQFLAYSIQFFHLQIVHSIRTVHPSMILASRP